MPSSASARLFRRTGAVRVRGRSAWSTSATRGGGRGSRRVRALRAAGGGERHHGRHGRLPQPRDRTGGQPAAAPGRDVRRARTATGARSAASWRTICPASRWSSALGWSPRSSSSRRRVRSYASSASAWRPTAVESKHELRDEALAVRALGDEAPELPDELPDACRGRDRRRRRARAFAVVPPRAAAHPQPRSRRARRQRRPVPATSASASRASSRHALDVACRMSLGSACRELLEPLGIEARRTKLQDIARAPAHQRRPVTVQQLPDSRDVHLERVRRRSGRRIAPDVVDQPIDRDDLALAQRGALPGLPRCFAPPSGISSPSSRASSGPRRRNSMPTSRLVTSVAKQVEHPTAKPI